jgi:hypothetical protein
MSNRFPAAYVLFAICLVWAEGMWFVSDRLLKAKVKSITPPRRSRRLSPEILASRLKQQRRKYRLQKWGISTVLFAGACVCIAYTARWNYEWELQQTFGLLTPANDPNPPDPCGFPPPANAIKVYAGGGLFWSNSDDFALLTIRGQKILSASIKGGAMAVSGDVYSPDGDLVHIDQNRFEAQTGGFKPERPDRHTLRVLDKWHKSVLYLRFLNAHAVQLRGIFWDPHGGASIELNDNYLLAPENNRFSAPCMGGTKNGITIN